MIEQIKKITGKIKTEVSENKAVVAVVLIIFVFVSGGYVLISGTSNAPDSSKTSQVLGASTQSLTPTPTSLPTDTPAPTDTPILSRSRTSNYIPVSTPTPTPTRVPASSNNSPTATPTPTPSSNSSQNANPTDTPTPTPTNVPTATPTPAGLSVEVDIDYAGQRTNDTYNTTVDAGSNAWTAVQKAVGSSNLKYTDYGGNLGIFITSFNGIDAASNQYYEFRVNGGSSNVGVSSYNVNNNDKLQFVLTSF